MFLVCSSAVLSMTPSSSVPQAAVEAGLPARYRYWTGRSGRRYLFTDTELSALLDFPESVAIAVRRETIVWAGEPHPASLLAAAAEIAGAAFYVHLLAADPAERRQAIQDLVPSNGPRLRVAA